MSKICPVCGYNCEDSEVVCPACGTPFLSTVNPVPPVNQVQTANNIQQPNGQAVAGQPMQQQFAQQPPKKKSNKTLWIILGVVGGVVLLLIVLVIILFLLFAFVFTGVNSTSLTSNGPTSIFTGGGSNGNYQEYYYPEYQDSSLNSEAFVDITTEASTEVSTENTGANIVFNETAAFRPEDLTILTVETDPAVAPVTLTFSENYSYMVGDSGELLQVGDMTYDTPAEFQGKQCQLGRGTTIGNSIDEFIAAYGVDTTNAIWQTDTNNKYEYFYYSTSTKPSVPEDASLIIGWYQSGDTWVSMTPEALFNYWNTGSIPDCDRILMYTIYSHADFSIKGFTTMYGTPEYFTKFYNNWETVKNLSDDTSVEE